MDDKKNEGSQPFDLSELAGFQFGPSWARKGAEASKSRIYEDIPDHDRTGKRRDNDRKPSMRDRRMPERGEGRRDTLAPSKRSERRERRGERPQRELPQPAEGLRVELRPANAILELFAKQIQRQKRALPLLDLSRVVMASKDRYDLVFMKLEDGPILIHSTMGDGACWLTEAEAIAYLWKADWFSKLYTREEVEIPAPTGTFTSVAKCSLGGELIGPANWHNYQASVMHLYRTKYAHMDLGAFKARIATDKSEEAIADWLKQVSHTTVWKPTRENAADVVLTDTKAVEADFKANHFDKVYEQTDKVFVNGATPRAHLSPGLAAHLSILSDKTRRFPQMLIPNLCHGLARHHIPIYKWQGHHYTGPSRVRAIPADMVLADRMTAIINWTKENSGQKVDAMCAALSGVPAGTDDTQKQAARDAYAPYVADMIWLLEQGFIVVTADNSIWYPKGEAAPEPTKAPSPQPRKKGKTKAAPKAAKPTEASSPAAPATTVATTSDAPADIPAEATAPIAEESTQAPPAPTSDATTASEPEAKGTPTEITETPPPTASPASPEAPEATAPADAGEPAASGESAVDTPGPTA